MQKFNNTIDALWLDISAGLDPVTDSISRIPAIPKFTTKDFGGVIDEAVKTLDLETTLMQPEVGGKLYKQDFKTVGEIPALKQPVVLQMGKNKVIFLPTGYFLIVVSDLHGQYFSIMTISNKLHVKKALSNGKTILLFLGDIGGRGEYQVECWYEILRLKIAYPKAVFILCGNHEEPIMANNDGLLAAFRKMFGLFDGQRLFNRLVGLFYKLSVVAFDSVARKMYVHASLPFVPKMIRVHAGKSEIVYADKLSSVLKIENLREIITWSDFIDIDNKSLAQQMFLGLFEGALFLDFEEDSELKGGLINDLDALCFELIDNKTFCSNIRQKCRALFDFKESGSFFKEIINQKAVKTLQKSMAIVRRFNDILDGKNVKFSVFFPKKIGGENGLDCLKKDDVFNEIERIATRLIVFLKFKMLFEYGIPVYNFLRNMGFLHAPKTLVDVKNKFEIEHFIGGHSHLFENGVQYYSKYGVTKTTFFSFNFDPQVFVTVNGKKGNTWFILDTRNSSDSNQNERNLRVANFWRESLEQRASKPKQSTVADVVDKDAGGDLDEKAKETV